MAQRKSTKKKEITREVSKHPFAAGTKVTVHEEVDVVHERATDREPIAKAVSKATVGKDASLEVSVPVKGTYCVSGPISDEEHRYVTFVVA